MNKLFTFFLFFSLLLFSACATMDQTSRTIFAANTGNAIGSVAGLFIGESMGGRHGAFIGSSIGSIVGTAAGVMVVAEENPSRNNSRRQEVFIQKSAELVVSEIILEDENNNEGIDAGELCKITFVIVNESAIPAINVRAILNKKNGAGELVLSDPVPIGRIDSDESVRYTVAVTALPTLKTGLADFEIILKEGDGNAVYNEIFSVRTIHGIPEKK
ncbi:hypothetical protein A9168_14700 [Macellibacteroides sp. HH-ZS]|nr:hypothetical protein A9168_14700 [Macellibacteroides sp. HH-ZS]